MLLGWAEGRGGFDTQARTSTGEGDNYPNLKVTILHQIPWEAAASAERCKAGYPQEAAAFPCKCSAPLVGFFGVGALIRGNIWDVLP